MLLISMQHISFPMWMKWDNFSESFIIYLILQRLISSSSNSDQASNKDKNLCSVYLSVKNVSTDTNALEIASKLQRERRDGISVLKLSVVDMKNGGEK